MVSVLTRKTNKSSQCVPPLKKNTINKSGNIIRVSGAAGTIRYRYDAGGMLVEQNDEGAGEITL